MYNTYVCCFFVRTSDPRCPEDGEGLTKEKVSAIRS